MYPYHKTTRNEESFYRKYSFPTKSNKKLNMELKTKMLNFSLQSLLVLVRLGLISSLCGSVPVCVCVCVCVCAVTSPPVLRQHWPIRCGWT